MTCLHIIRMTCLLTWKVKTLKAVGRALLLRQWLGRGEHRMQGEPVWIKSPFSPRRDSTTRSGINTSLSPILSGFYHCSLYFHFSLCHSHTVPVTATKTQLSPASHCSGSLLTAHCPSPLLLVNWAGEADGGQPALTATQQLTIRILLCARYNRVLTPWWGTSGYLNHGGVNEGTNNMVGYNRVLTPWWGT